MQDLGAEVGELGRFGERQLRHEQRVGDHARIGGQHAVDVGPDLDLVDVEAGAEDRGRIVGAAAPERRRDAARRGADEAAHHRDLAGGGLRADDGVRALRGGVHVRDRAPCARRR